jgi:hypothetical protein
LAARLKSGHSRSFVPGRSPGQSQNQIKIKVKVKIKINLKIKVKSSGQEWTLHTGCASAAVKPVSKESFYRRADALRHPQAT